jgi:hypothetical protein
MYTPRLSKWGNNRNRFIHEYKGRKCQARDSVDYDNGGSINLGSFDSNAASYHMVCAILRHMLGRLAAIKCWIAAKQTGLMLVQPNWMH